MLSPPRPLCAQDMSKYSTFLFDCDGVLWRGSQPIEGVASVLAKLRAASKKILFVTNNATKSRETYVKKFHSMGIVASVEDIITSASGTAAYMKHQLGMTGKVFVIGESGLVDELSASGFSVVASTADPTTSFECSEVDLNVQAVVIGLDTAISYRKLAYGTHCIRAIPKCLFIATNSDSTYPAGGAILPGGGALVAALETACGRSPDHCVGKPSQELMKMILTSHALDITTTCMVGDRLSTDILFGNRAGMSTLLVFTGITQPEELTTASPEAQPTYTLASLADMATFL